MARILIVDDSILMRRNLRTLLKEAGHEVVAEASNGLEAYREYEKHRPDLVTLDITMPVMSGIDALKKIIAAYPEANIIMISALDQRNLVFEAIQSGAKHYILKPITIEKILKIVDEVLKEAGLPAADTEQAAVEASSPPGPAPLSIENNNGVIIISIRPGIGKEGFETIRTAISGFLFIKPLQVLFRFDGVKSLSDAGVEEIRSCMRNILAADGNVRMASTDTGFIQRLRSEDEALFSRIPSDSGQ